MTAVCDFERLEDLVLGALSPAPAAAVHAHLAECTDCRGELALLRAERGAIEQRAGALADVPSFEGVLARIHPPEAVARAVPTTAARPARRVPTPWIIAGVAAVALAAALLLGLGHHEPAPVITAVATTTTAAPITAPPPAAATPLSHSSLSCESERAHSCNTCSGDDEDAGEP